MTFKVSQSLKQDGYLPVGGFVGSGQHRALLVGATPQQLDDGVLVCA